MPRIRSVLPKRRFVPPPQEDKALRDLIPAYEQARDALAKAKTLDEVKSIPKKFDRLRAAGRISDDFEFDLKLAEIKLGEVRRIGEISRGLEKSKGGRGKTGSDDGNSFKLTTLAEAGISKSRAYRAENVAAIEQHHFDEYLKECRLERKPVTVNDLLETVSTRVRVADLDDRDLDAETAERQARRQAQQREHGVSTIARRPLDKILRLVERKLRDDKDEQLIELALVAASYFNFRRYREILARLLSDDAVTDAIRARKGEERSLLIYRLLEDLGSELRGEELAEDGFMPPARESVQRRVIRAKREGRRASRRLRD
jgi:hypothetical protein